MSIWLSSLGSCAENSLAMVKENPKDTNALPAIQAQEKVVLSSPRWLMRIKVVGVRNESPEQAVCPVVAKRSITNDSVL